MKGSELSYDWQHEGKPHQGTLTLTADGVDFSNTFLNETMPCKRTLGAFVCAGL